MIKVPLKKVRISWSWAFGRLPGLEDLLGPLRRCRICRIRRYKHKRNHPFSR